MAHTGTVSLIPLVFTAGHTLSVADGWDYLTMPFDAVIWRVQMSVAYLGTTGAGVHCVIERTDADAATTDLWTVTEGTIGGIAYNAAAKYLEWDWEDDGWTGYAAGQLYPPSGCRLKKGDTLKLNINDVDDGGVAEGLKLTLWVRPLAD
jgi:hypothetical protein